MNPTLWKTKNRGKLNQVEIWFGIFQRKTLRNASFSSVDQLVQAIQKFTAAYNQNAAPFVWRKREVKGAATKYYC